MARIGRRVLAHVPPSMCGKRMAFAFAFRSDTTYEYEGVYIDDITVWGTRDVDAAPVSNDPYSGRQWALVHSGQLPRGAANPQVPEAWSAVAVSPDLKVAVVDFGIPRPHPDLRIERGWGPNGGDGSPPAGMLFFTEHGTACAGIVGALKDNGEGVAGVAPGVSILPICLVDVDELGLPFWDDAWAAEALRKAVDLGARIVSNSWGGGELSETVHQAFRYGSAKGALFLCSAGNSNWDVEFPAALTADRTVNVVAVGSSSPCDERYGPSCCGGRAYGSCFDAGGGIAPDVVAPGGWIYTTDLPGALGYNGDAFQEGIDLDVTAYFGGTSAACPFAAGVAALMLSKDPALAASAVKGLLRSTADPAGASRETGKGRVNAFKAVQAIAGPSQCDLACKPGSLTFTFNRTEGLSVSVVVTNLGTDPAAAPFDVRILLDAAEVFRESVGELPAGAERSFSKIPYTAARTLQPGEAHAIVVEIDPGKACGERDEDNNSCIASFMVPDIYFKRGDANSDGRMNLADGIFILRYIFSSGDDPTCSYAADANDDGMLTIPDAIAIFQALFTPNSPLAPPGSFACGPDGKADGLRVCVHPPCEGAARRR